MYLFAPTRSLTSGTLAQEEVLPVLKSATYFSVIRSKAFFFLHIFDVSILSAVAFVIFSSKTLHFFLVHNILPLGCASGYSAPKHLCIDSVVLHLVFTCRR